MFHSLRCFTRIWTTLDIVYVITEFNYLLYSGRYCSCASIIVPAAESITCQSDNSGAIAPTIRRSKSNKQNDQRGSRSPQNSKTLGHCSEEAKDSEGESIWFTYEQWDNVLPLRVQYNLVVGDMTLCFLQQGRDLSIAGGSFDGTDRHLAKSNHFL